jgi:hypothetical protein
VFFLLFKRNNNEKTLRVIFFYILYCIINEALSYYFHRVHFENIFILFDSFTVVEFSLFCLFYYYALSPGLMKKAILPIWLCFLIFASIHLFLVNDINSFDSITSGVETILIILMCIYFLVVQIKGSNDLLVYSTTNFWIIITFLIYLCGTFFLYIMAENMIKDRAFQIQYVIINSAFNILKNILLSVAMLMKPSTVPNQILKNNDRDNLFSYKLKN